MATESRHYRFTQNDIDNIARLGRWLREETGIEPTDSDVIRYALLVAVKRYGLLPKSNARKKPRQGQGAKP